MLVSLPASKLAAFSGVLALTALLSSLLNTSPQLLFASVSLQALMKISRADRAVRLNGTRAHVRVLLRLAHVCSPHSSIPCAAT